MISFLRRAWARLFRREPARSADTADQTREALAICTSTALANIGRGRVTVADCLAACATDKRSTTAEAVIAHLQGMAINVVPLRDVVPVECIPSAGWPAPPGVWVRRPGKTTPSLSRVLMAPPSTRKSQG